jgi:hypothetical protein
MARPRKRYDAGVNQQDAAQRMRLGLLAHALLGEKGGPAGGRPQLGNVPPRSTEPLGHPAQVGPGDALPQRGHPRGGDVINRRPDGLDPAVVAKYGEEGARGRALRQAEGLTLGRDHEANARTIAQQKNAGSGMAGGLGFANIGKPQKPSLGDLANREVFRKGGPAGGRPVMPTQGPIDEQSRVMEQLANQRALRLAEDQRMQAQAKQGGGQVRAAGHDSGGYNPIPQALVRGRRNRRRSQRRQNEGWNRFVGHPSQLV